MDLALNIKGFSLPYDETNIFLAFLIPVGNTSLPIGKKKASFYSHYILLLLGLVLVCFFGTSYIYPTVIRTSSSKCTYLPFHL